MTKRISFAERFWRNVEITTPDECWEWKKSCYPNGYGQTGTTKADGSRGSSLAHRIAWELTNGTIPDKMSVLHHCDNRHCCNPAHLFIGTQLDNIKDMHAKGRQRGNYHTGETHGAKITWEIVREIRKLHAEQGISAVKLACVFPIKKSQIGNIIANKAWIE